MHVTQISKKQQIIQYAWDEAPKLKILKNKNY
jgi:hypothetical protein